MKLHRMSEGFIPIWTKEDLLNLLKRTGRDVDKLPVSKETKRLNKELLKMK
jgi:hypothetical protein